MHRRLKPLFPLIAAALIALLAPTGAQATVKGFKFGVSSGDVHAHSSLFWARARHEGIAVLEVRRNGDFINPCPVDRSDYIQTRKSTDGGVFFRRHQVLDENNLTVQANVGDLASGVTYKYHWCMSRGRHSAVGHIETPPGAEQRQVIHFSLSGDQDAQNQPGHRGPYWNRFEVLSQILTEHNDFNMLMGDTIYSDSEVPGVNRLAWTVAQKWGKYRKDLRKPFSRLRGSTSFYGHWDDHEFINDFSPFENGVIHDAIKACNNKADTPPCPARRADQPANARDLYQRGVRAFRDYTPIEYSPQDGIYRTVRWGKNLELFMLDERSFRSAKASANGKCDNPEGSGNPDVAPTAPQSTRNFFSILIPSLANPPPPGCLAAINNKNRTMLGHEQLVRFERAIKRSDATFKVIMNEVPIQQFYALPYDRWEGYAHERLQLIRFLRDNVENAVFLSTDVHANMVNDVRLKTLESGGPVNSGITEATNGPIATKSFSKEIDGVAGPGSGQAIYAAFFKPPPPNGTGQQCSADDIFSYAEVTVTKGQLRVDLKDQNGDPVREGSNGGGSPCAPVIIPAQ
jgi:phosphodiesterase/alkaline phosphatase D-like protein